MSITRRKLLTATTGLLLAPRLLPAQPAPDPASRPAAGAALADRCDAILAAAIKSPYGYGWNEEVQGIDLMRARPRGKPPSIDAALTAAAGLLLHLAGEATGDGRFTLAAVEAGRGLLAVQTRPGQIRTTGVMGAFGGTMDDAADVPDRRPTTAALATLLTILASQPRQDARLRGPTLKAAHWLGGQQTRAGGWPNLHPPGAAKGEGAKLLVLNDADHRDTALVTLLASEVLTSVDYRGTVTPERQLQLFFTRAVDMLIFARLHAGLPPVRALWPILCKLDGDPHTRRPDVPICVDLLSSRYALEVVLGGYLVAQEGAYGDALKAARDVLPTLPRDDQKRWHRRYDLQFKPILPLQPDTGGVFRPPAPPGPPEMPTRTPQLFSRLEQVLELGAKRSYDQWQQSAPMLRRLALVVSGFSPDLMLADKAIAAGADVEPLTRSNLGAIAGMIEAGWEMIE